MTSESRGRGLANIKQFVVPMSVVAETLEFLKDVGRDGCEGFVLWGGRIESQTCFRFTSSFIPRQQASRTESGLLVYVEGEALFEVNKTLFERGEVLGAQVHSHPTHAYHSAVDNAYPLATLTGALSVVIPDFACNAPDDLQDWAWYRLAHDGTWRGFDDDTKVVFL